MLNVQSAPTGSKKGAGSASRRRLWKNARQGVLKAAEFVAERMELDLKAARGENRTSFIFSELLLLC